MQSGTPPPMCPFDVTARSHTVFAYCKQSKIGTALFECTLTIHDSDSPLPPPPPPPRTQYCITVLLIVLLEIAAGIVGFVYRDTIVSCIYICLQPFVCFLMGGTNRMTRGLLSWKSDIVAGVVRDGASCLLYCKL